MALDSVPVLQLELASLLQAFSDDADDDLEARRIIQAATAKKARKKWKASTAKVGNAIAMSRLQEAFKSRNLPEAAQVTSHEELSTAASVLVRLDGAKKFDIFKPLINANSQPVEASDTAAGELKAVTTDATLTQQAVQEEKKSPSPVASSLARSSADIRQKAVSIEIGGKRRETCRHGSPARAMVEKHIEQLHTAAALPSARDGAGLGQSASAPALAPSARRRARAAQPWTTAHTPSPSSPTEAPHAVNPWRGKPMIGGAEIDLPRGARSTFARSGIGVSTSQGKRTQLPIGKQAFMSRSVAASTAVVANDAASHVAAVSRENEGGRTPSAWCGRQGVDGEDANGTSTAGTAEATAEAKEARRERLQELSRQQQSARASQSSNDDTAACADGVGARRSADEKRKAMRQKLAESQQKLQKANPARLPLARRRRLEVLHSELRHEMEAESVETPRLAARRELPPALATWTAAVDAHRRNEANSTGKQAAQLPALKQPQHASEECGEVSFRLGDGSATLTQRRPQRQAEARENELTKAVNAAALPKIAAITPSMTVTAQAPKKDDYVVSFSLTSPPPSRGRVA